MSGQSNLSEGRIATAHERFSRIHHVAPMCIRVHSPNSISMGSAIFGRPFVKRFTLCYRTFVLSVCLSVTLVHCDRMVGRIKMKLGMQVGLSPGHILLDWDPGPAPQKGQSPQFSTRVCCAQTAGWIKMPLAMEVGLG